MLSWVDEPSPKGFQSCGGDSLKKSRQLRSELWDPTMAMGLHGCGSIWNCWKLWAGVEQPERPLTCGALTRAGPRAVGRGEIVLGKVAQPR